MILFNHAISQSVSEILMGSKYCSTETLLVTNTISPVGRTEHPQIVHLLCAVAFPSPCPRLPYP